VAGALCSASTHATSGRRLQRCRVPTRSDTPLTSWQNVPDIMATPALGLSHECRSRGDADKLREGWGTHLIYPKERGWHRLRISAFPTTVRQSRRIMSAALLLVYFCAYVALGFVHTHAAARAQAPANSCVATAAAGQGEQVLQPARTATGDPVCSLCKAAHAATIALAQPTGALHAPARPQPVATLRTLPAPARSLPASPSRGPPAV
jgi:hypothetical protein